MSPNILRARVPALLIAAAALMAVGWLIYHTIDKPPKDTGAFFKGPFSEQAAMQLLFGNYDRTKRVSVWRSIPLQDLPRDERGNGMRSVFDGSAEGLAQAYKSFIGQDKLQYLFFTTVGNYYTEDVYNRNHRPGGICHACPVVLGGAVFELRGRYWTLKAKELLLDTLGSYGQAPRQVEVTEWGPGRLGLSVRESDFAQGEFESMSLYGFDGAKLFRAYTASLKSDGCGVSDEGRQESAELRFQRRASRGAYDIQLLYTARRCSGVISAQETARYVFDGRTYVEEKTGLPLQFYSDAIASNHGDADAILRIARGYRDGQYDISRDLARARQWFARAAECSGSPSVATAMNELAMMLQKGQGGPPDYNAAIKWLEKAAQMGNAVATYNLGYSYYHGVGVPKDFEAALEWYKRGVALGSAESMNSIGFMYERGDGLPKDDQAALRWYSRATSAGSETGRKNFANLMQRYYVGAPVQVGRRNPGYVDFPKAKRLRNEAVDDLEQSLERARKVMR